MTSSAGRWSDPATAEHILRSFRVWAVVGCSSDPARASFGVSRYLMRHGFDVIPINPNETMVHGHVTYPDLMSVPPDRRATIEVVDLFRRSELVLPHVEEAIAIGARAVWMQLDVWNEEAAELAAGRGLEVVMGRCPAIDHPALIGASSDVREDGAPSRIRRARPDEAEELTALARRAKAHWGYDAEFMDRVGDAMTLTTADIAAHQVWVLRDAVGRIVGFHRVIGGDPAELEDLWIEPDAMGMGHGRRLFDHAVAIARSGGATALELDADPNALGFYRRMGMERIGETASTVIPGRSLPRMRIRLDR